MVFELPAPELQDSEPLAGCIQARRSVREYTNAQVPMVQRVSELEPGIYE